MTIASLIDKLDGFETVRAKIVQILVNEVAAQKALATAAGKDPALWDLKVYEERANAWESYLQSDTVPVPVVNVWHDDANYDMGRGNVIERQGAEGTFNIDVYGFGKSQDVAGGGHLAGDKEAALATSRAVRLVRNILMAAEYTYLDLRGVVGQRWTSSTKFYQPQIDDNAAQQVHAARITFTVRYNELSPQVEAVDLETILLTVKRAEDGSTVLEAQYDATP